MLARCLPGQGETWRFARRSDAGCDGFAESVKEAGDVGVEWSRVRRGDGSRCQLREGEGEGEGEGATEACQSGVGMAAQHSTSTGSQSCCSGAGREHGMATPCSGAVQCSAAGLRRLAGWWWWWGKGVRSGADPSYLIRRLRDEKEEGRHCRWSAERFARAAYF